MKKFVLPLVAATAFSASVFATEHSYNVSVSPLGLLFGSLNAKVEAYKLFGKKIVPAVEGSYWSFSSGGADYSVWTLGASGRIYRNSINFSGLFAQFGIEFGSVSVDTTLGDGSSTAFGGYILGGYRWALGQNDKITVDVGIGAGYYTGSVDIDGETYDAFSGFLPKAIFALGVNF